VDDGGIPRERGVIMPELACNDLIGDLWEWDGWEEAFPVAEAPNSLL